MRNPPATDSVPWSVEVSKVGTFDHSRSPSSCFRRTTYDERQGFLEQLREHGPTGTHRKNMKKPENIPYILSRNFDSCKTIDVMRNLKSIINKEENLHQVLTVQLGILQSLYESEIKDPLLPGVIRERCIEPLRVIFISAAEIRLLNSLMTETQPIFLHIDATGSMLTNHCADGSIFLYSIVTTATTAVTSTPIGNYITNSHSVASIAHFLKVFRHSLLQLTSHRWQTDLPIVFVTDFSWAHLHACLDFHHCDFSTYMQLQYHYFEQERPNESNHGIFLCANHLIKSICQLVKREK